MGGRIESRGCRGKWGFPFVLMRGRGCQEPGVPVLEGCLSPASARLLLTIPKPPGASSFDPLDGNFCFKGFELRVACDEFCAPLFC
jgi:hypothetical protein